MRWWIILIVGLVVATIYSVIDCAMIPANRVRGLKKPAWILIILLLPVLGVILWFTVGRARAGHEARPQLAPDDDPAFIGTLGRDKEQDERIRRLEEELAALDSDAADPDVTGKATPTPDDSPDNTGGHTPDDSGRTDA
ncbi:MAG: PLD nuclease N-terminal domain-containing protein [Mycetocola sp.]